MQQEKYQSMKDFLEDLESAIKNYEREEKKWLNGGIYKIEDKKDIIGSIHTKTEHNNLMNRLILFDGLSNQLYDLRLGKIDFEMNEIEISLEKIIDFWKGEKYKKLEIGKFKLHYEPENRDGIYINLKQGNFSEKDFQDGLMKLFIRLRGDKLEINKIFTDSLYYNREIVHLHLKGEITSQTFLEKYYEKQPIMEKDGVLKSHLCFFENQLNKIIRLDYNVDRAAQKINFSLYDNFPLNEKDFPVKYYVAEKKLEDDFLIKHDPINEELRRDLYTIGINNIEIGRIAKKIIKNSYNSNDFLLYVNSGDISLTLNQERILRVYH